MSVLRLIRRCFLLVSLYLISSTIVLSQNLEGNNWIFGGASGIKFLPKEQRINNAKNSASSSVVTISDGKGNLQFYADANVIYNYNHDTVFSFSSSAGMVNLIATKQPSSNSDYWLFAKTTLGSELFYYQIDMTANNFQGEVVRFGQFPDSAMNQGLAVLDHRNNIDKWLLFLSDTGAFVTYRITSFGLDLGSRRMSQSVGNIFRTETQLKSSPNSRYVAVTHRIPIPEVQLFQFSKDSGLVKTMIYSEDLEPSFATYPFTCFSANNEVLFVAERHRLWAYSVSSEDSLIISNSKTLIDSNAANAGGQYYPAYLDMQLSIDGNIYLINYAYTSTNKLSVIPCPNSALKHKILKDTVLGPLGQFLGTQLPTLNQTLYVNTHKLQAQSTEDTLLCSSDSTQLVAYGAGADQFVWEPANGLSCSNCSSPKASPDTSTTYRVIGIASACTQDDFDTAYVRVNVIPEKGQISITGDSLFCEGDSVILRGPFGFDQYEWLNDSTRSPSNFIKDTGKIALSISGKCYSDTLYRNMSYYEALSYVFPQNRSLCAKELPITLQASSNYDLLINGKADSLIAVTSPAQVLFEALGPCSQASKTVLVDSIDLGPIKDWNKDSVEKDARMNTSADLYYRSNSGEWQNSGDSISFSEVGEYEVYQIRESGSCTDTIQLGELNIFEEDNSVCKVQISPNPGGDFLKVESNQELEQLRMIDARGRLVYDYVGTKANVYQINLPELAKGTYLLRMQCANNETKEMKWVRE